MKRKRKIIVTETQFRAITESDDIVANYRKAMDKIIETANAQFGLLMFSSLADVLEGNPDLEVVERKITEMNKIYNSHLDRFTNFMNRLPDNDEYYDKWQDIETELDSLSNKVFYKLNTLENMVMTYRELASEDVEQHFSDIKTRKI